VSTEAIRERLETLTRGSMAMQQLAQDRLSGAIASLLAGDFSDALERAQEAVAKLAPLAQAEAAFLRLGQGGVSIVRSSELAEGMTVIGWGRVVAVEAVEAPGATKDAVKLTWADPAGEEYERLLSLDSEWIVELAGEEDGRG
jgi:hypothetical protein